MPDNANPTPDERRVQITCLRERCAEFDFFPAFAFIMLLLKGEWLTSHISRPLEIARHHPRSVGSEMP